MPPFTEKNPNQTDRNTPAASPAAEDGKDIEESDDS